MLIRAARNTPGRTRTCDLRIRNPLLCPAELRAQKLSSQIIVRIFSSSRAKARKIKSVDYNHLNQGLAHTVKTADGWNWNYGDQANFEDTSVHDQMVLEAYKRAKVHGIRMMFVGKPFLGPGADKIDPAITNELCGIVPFQESKDHVWKSEHHKLLAPAVPPCFKPWRETVIQPNGEIRECYFHNQGRYAHFSAGLHGHIY